MIPNGIEQGFADAVQDEGVKMRKGRASCSKVSLTCCLQRCRRSVLFDAHAAQEIAEGRHLDEELVGGPEGMYLLYPAGR